MLAFRSAVKARKSLPSQIYNSQRINLQQKRNIIKIVRDTQNKSVKLTWVGLPGNSIQFQLDNVNKNNANVFSNYLTHYENRYNRFFKTSFLSSVPLTAVIFIDCDCHSYYSESLLFQTICVANLAASYYLYHKSSQFTNLKIKTQERLYPNSEDLPENFYDKVYKNMKRYDNASTFFFLTAFPALALLGMGKFGLVTILPLISAMLFTRLASQQMKIYNNKLFNKK